MGRNISKSLGYIAELDGLRAFAVFFVMLAHANFQFGENGWIGVDIFFALSGFLITSLLLDEYEANGDIDILRFYKRRFFRLVPGMIFILFVVSIFVYFCSFDKWSIYLEELLASLLYIYNISWYWGLADRPFILFHMWSLGVEEQFYILWPIFILFLARLFSVNFFLVLLSIIVFLLFLRSFFFSMWLFNSIYYDSIVFGALLALTVRKLELNFLINNGLLYLSFICLTYFSVFPSRFAADILQSGLRGFFGIVTCVMIINLVYGKSNTLIHVLLGSKPLIAIGKISYGLYLWHVPVFIGFRLLSPLEPYQNFILKFIISLILSIFSYFLIERNFIQFSRRNYSASING